MDKNKEKKLLFIRVGLIFESIVLFIGIVTIWAMRLPEFYKMVILFMAAPTISIISILVLIWYLQIWSA